MYVHFMIGKPFRDSRIRGITPSHHPSRDREDGRSSFINPASHPWTPPSLLKRVVRDAGVPPCFRPRDGRPEVVGELRARRADAHAHLHNPLARPLARPRYNHLSFAWPSFEPRACAPWTKDSLAGLRCIPWGGNYMGYMCCAALRCSAWASTVVYIGTTATGCS